MIHIHTNNNEQSNRLFGLDIARLLAMLMMVQGHTIYCLIDVSILNSDSIFWNTWTFIRGFTAPVFLMVSGIVHIFANRRTENGKLPSKLIKKRLKTCLMLLFIGYLLQLPVNNLYDLPFLSEDLLNSFLKVNVLQLFSVVLITLMLFFVITKNDKQLAVLSFIYGNALILFSYFMLHINWIKILPVFIAPYFTFETGSIFPVTPFAGYFFIGISIGYLLKQINTSKRNHFIISRFSLIGLPYIIVGTVLDYLCSSGQFSLLETTELNIGVSLYRVGVSLWVCVIGTLLSSPLNSFQNAISMFSKRSLFIYVLHLLIIYGTPFSPGLRHVFYQVDPFTAFYCAFFVIFFSSLLVWIYENTHMKTTPNYLYKYFIVALLIYMLLI